MKANAYAAPSAVAPLAPFTIQRRGPGAHDVQILNAYLILLRRDGTLTQVGLPPEPLAIQVSNLIHGRRNFSGSLIGGIKETQEMLDFCGQHNITADIELIPISLKCCSRPSSDMNHLDRSENHGAWIIKGITNVALSVWGEDPMAAM